MNEQGAQTDIVSNRPLAESQGPAQEARRQAELSRLKDKMRLLGAGETFVMQQLQASIEKILMRRIKKILSNDPEAKACAQILKDIGGEVISAKAAAQKFVKDYAKF